MYFRLFEGPVTSLFSFESSDRRNSAAPGSMKLAVMCLSFMAQTISMPAMHGEEGINTTSALDEEKEITKVLMKKYFQILLKKG